MGELQIITALVVGLYLLCALYIAGAMYEPGEHGVTRPEAVAVGIFWPLLIGALLIILPFWGMWTLGHRSRN